MNSLGLFEAKTKFSEICAQVASSGKAVTVTRRGKPIVRIEPIAPSTGNPPSVWERRAQYVKRHGQPKDDFDLPARQKQKWRNPLTD